MHHRMLPCVIKNYINYPLTALFNFKFRTYIYIVNDVNMGMGLRIGNLFIDLTAIFYFGNLRRNLLT